MVYKPSSMILAAVVAIGLGATAQAGILQVAGSPEYDPATQTGLKDGEIPYAPGWGVNNSGTAVGRSIKYDSGTDMGLRAVRWDASGTAATELGYLGLSTSNSTAALALAVNDAGITVGRSNKYDSGIYKGYRAVRWDASGIVATELGNLGTDINSSTNTEALAVNAGGTAVGGATLYLGGVARGVRPVCWDASGAVTELGNLGTFNNSTNGRAMAVNNAGTAVGWVQKPGQLFMIGTRAVRWDASGAITELGNLGFRPTDKLTNAQAVAVNAGGTAVGWATKYVSGSPVGDRAVRWDASGTVATELDNLGLSGSNSSTTSAYAVNDANTAVGYAQKYVSGNLVGTRAVRWDGSGTTATELGNLGLDANNSTSASAYAVNGAGTAVGYAQKYDLSGDYVSDRAVIWLPDASAIDLNDLGVVPVPAGGAWTLTTARALSADGWVAGSGAFDPDGDGPQASYTRHWVAQVGLGGTWTNAAGGTWGRGPNWSTGTPAMRVGNATFDLNSAYTVALDRNELTQTIAINAGTVTINFNGHTLTTENGLSIANGATLKVDGTIVSDIINAGTLGGTGIATLSARTITANSLTILNNAKVTTTGGKTHTSVLGSLAFGGTDVAPLGKLDLGDGLLAINYTDASPLATVLKAIKAAYSGGTWAGNGITSSLLAADPTGKYGIGYVENSALLAPFGPTRPFGDYTGADDTTVLVRYTLIGDVNLDGTINDADISLVTNNIGQVDGGWLGGDVFGYDNIVNDSDISLTTNNIGQSVGQLTGGISELSAVPEPATLALLALGGLMALRRRR